MSEQKSIPCAFYIGESAAGPELTTSLPCIPEVGDEVRIGVMVYIVVKRWWFTPHAGPDDLEVGFQIEAKV